MKKPLLRILSIFILYPYIVGFTTDSTGTSAIELIFRVGSGSTNRYLGSCFDGYHGTLTIPHKEAAGSIAVKHDVWVAGTQAGYYETESRSLTYLDELGYVTDVHNAAKSYYVSPFAGINLPQAEVRIGAMYSVSENKNQMFPAGKCFTSLTAFARIGDKRNRFFFTCSYMSNVPLISGGGIWDAGLGAVIGSAQSSSSPEVWVGIFRMDNENTAIGLRYATAPFLNIRATASFSIPTGGMFAKSVSGDIPYAIGLGLTTELGF
ncbi:MAG: hypothetical protein HUU54_16260 [Ignavibacteriaceae bacterium]|nr:hypothetical protein [Ignavibacteriaceae bacterium]